VIIAGAGGAAHLPGMVAALTPLPVIGVPVKPTGAHLDGLDALLSIIQVCTPRESSCKLTQSDKRRATEKELLPSWSLACCGRECNVCTHARADHPPLPMRLCS